LVSLYYYYRIIRETFFESQDQATKALPLELSPLATFTLITHSSFYSLCIPLYVKTRQLTATKTSASYLRLHISHLVSSI